MIAVEPIDEMRTLLAAAAHGAERHVGTAEAIPLDGGTVDAVTVAQAFHWFDVCSALAEIHRVLRPNGPLAIVWNSRDLSNPLQRALEDVLAPLRGEMTAQELGAWRSEGRALAALPVSRDGAILAPAAFHDGRAGGARRLDELRRRPSRVRPRRFVGRVRGLTVALPEPFAFPYRTDVFLLERTDRSIE